MGSWGSGAVVAVSGRVAQRMLGGRLGAGWPAPVRAQHDDELPPLAFSRSGHTHVSSVGAFAPCFEGGGFWISFLHQARAHARFAFGGVLLLLAARCSPDAQPCLSWCAVQAVDGVRAAL